MVYRTERLRGAGPTEVVTHGNIDRFPAKEKK